MLTALGLFIARTPALRNGVLTCAYEWVDVTAFGDWPRPRLIAGRYCAFPRYMPHVCMTLEEVTQ